MGGFQRASAGLAIAGMVLIMLAAAIISVDVVLRAALATPLQIRADFEKVVMAIALGCGFPLVMLRERAIVVRLASRSFGRWGAVPRAFGNLCSAGFFGIAAWQLGRYAIETAGAGETLATIALPIWPFWAVIAFTLALSAVAAVAALRNPPGEEGEFG